MDDETYKVIQSWFYKTFIGHASPMSGYGAIKSIQISRHTGNIFVAVYADHIRIHNFNFRTRVTDAVKSYYISDPEFFQKIEQDVRAWMKNEEREHDNKAEWPPRP